jgi:hypothetical protein
VDDRDESEGRKMSISKESVEGFTAWARGPKASIGEPGSPMRAIAELAVHLYDENDRLRAERDEAHRVLDQAAEKLGYPYYEQSSENRAGWLVRIVAKLRGTP